MVVYAQHQLDILDTLLAQRAPRLSERFGSKYVAGADEFVFGAREDWLGGLQKKLGDGY